MILDGIWYLVILFCRVILCVWCSSPVFSLFPDEYLGTSTSTYVSGRLSTPYVSSPYDALIDNALFTSLQDF